jgi:hypothetical protein
MPLPRSALDVFASIPGGVAAVNNSVANVFLPNGAVLEQVASALTTNYPGVGTNISNNSLSVTLPPQVRVGSSGVDVNALTFMLEVNKLAKDFGFDEVAWCVLNGGCGINASSDPNLATRNNP